VQVQVLVQVPVQEADVDGPVLDDTAFDFDHYPNGPGRGFPSKFDSSSLAQPAQKAWQFY
jgi:hypothetical protein